MTDKGKEIGGAVVLFGVLAALGAAYYFLVYKKGGKGGNDDAYSQFDNFKMVQANLGTKAGKDNIVVAWFNDKKNVAQFYTNNRVIIFNDKGQYLVKGTYSNGGYTITLDNGKVFDSGSVWKNIIDAVK